MGRKSVGSPKTTWSKTEWNEKERSKELG